MTNDEKMYVREAKYGIIAALDALEQPGANEGVIRSVLSITLSDLQRALGETA